MTYMARKCFVWLPMDTASTHVLFVIVPRIHVERQKWHTAIADLQAMVLHDVATHCHCIFYQIFLCVVIYEFSLPISMNYTENVIGLAWTVDTRCSSPIFVEYLEWGYIIRLYNAEMPLQNVPVWVLLFVVALLNDRTMNICLTHKHTQWHEHVLVLLTVNKGSNRVLGVL